jgi:hypothetical protein
MLYSKEFLKFLTSGRSKEFLKFLTSGRSKEFLKFLTSGRRGMIASHAATGPPHHVLPLNAPSTAILQRMKPFRGPTGFEGPFRGFNAPFSTTASPL